MLYVCIWMGVNCLMFLCRLLAKPYLNEVEYDIMIVAINYLFRLIQLILNF